MNFRQVALLSVLALASPAVTLEARQQWGTRSGSQAYGEGYQRGLRAGDEDRRRSQEYDFSDEGDYRRADAGYRREYGNEDWYRSDFRRGYQEGYRTGYDGSAYGRAGGPPYGRGNGRGPNGVPGYGTYGRYDLAASNGYNDGYEAGLDDGRDGRRNDPVAESRYRSGDHGYRDDYGVREGYKIRYRDAFRGGYEQGYRDGARTNSRPWYRPF